MAIGKKVRLEILKRDNFKCTYCGRKPPEVTLEVDHIIAVTQGGSDLPENLATACFDCNRGKGANGLGAALIGKRDLKAERKALKQAKEFLKLEAERQEILEKVFWYTRDYYLLNVSEYGPSNFEQSIKYFCRKLSREQIVEAVDSTVSKKKRSNLDPIDCFRYFCGICHNKIKGGN